MVEPLWNDEPRRYFITQGLELGAYVFDRLHRALDEASRGHRLR